MAKKRRLTLEEIFLEAISGKVPAGNVSSTLDEVTQKGAGHLLKERIEVMLESLTPCERDIIKLRYGLGDGHTYTLGEVSYILKITLGRVRSLEAKAVRKLQRLVWACQVEGLLDETKKKAEESSEE